MSILAAEAASSSASMQQINNISNLAMDTASSSASMSASLSATLTTTNDKVLALTDNLKALETRINSLSDMVIANASTSALLLQMMDAQLNTNASSSAQFMNQLTGLPIDSDGNATVSGKLMVLGRTTLGDLGVTGSISMGTMKIENDSIDNLGADLKLQSQATGGIDILAGKVVIDKNGNATFNENVTFAKDVEIKGVLNAKTINTGELKVNKSTITEVSSTEITSTKPAGTTTIAAGETYRIITSSLIKANSLIYATALSDTDNQTLYVSDITNGQATVTIKYPTTLDIKFNFLIVNQE
jgi:hypothetical protein